MSWTGNCDDCRSLFATWAIFLALALLGTLAVRWRRWTLLPTIAVWAIEARDQLAFLYAGLDRALIYHAFAAISVGVLAPLVAAVVPRRSAKSADGAA